MATRCIINIEGITYASVYIHWDGYPDAKLPFLEAFNKEFLENRGDDPEYKFAQLLRHTALKQDEFDLDPSEYTGYGVNPYDPTGKKCGADYVYMLKADGSVTYKSGEY